MTQIKVRYLVRKPGRGGTARYFWQPSRNLHAAGWRSVRLAEDVPADQAEGAAVAEAQAWNGRLDRWRTGEYVPNAGAAAPGSIDALIRDYKASRFYLKRKPSTRRFYDQNMDIISEWAGEFAVPALSAKACETFYQQMADVTPSKANAVMRVLRLVLACAPRLYKPGEPGFVRHADNPAREMRLTRVSTVPIIWTPGAVAHFAATADRMGLPSIGDAVLANHWLGQRQGDILGLPKSIYKGGILRVTQSKTGARVDLPVDMITGLTERFEAAYERHRKARVTATTIIVCEMTGRRWLADTFRRKFAEVRAAAAKKMPTVKQPHLDEPVPFTRLWFMQLRHTAVVRLAEAGCTRAQIHAITGHTLTSIDTILGIYLVATGDMARAAFAKRLEKERE